MTDRSRAVNIALAFLFISTASLICRADPSTTAPPLKPGASDITFGDRCPLSSKAELAKRLSLSPADMGDDYGLSQCPYKIYVPKSIDPANPPGVLVYLGYKDSVSTPPLWGDLLDKVNLIFITPYCHTGDQYQPSMPLWQTMGLALDAVYNLQHRTTIDGQRVYLMDWNDNTKINFVAADVFTGFVPIGDNLYFGGVLATNGGVYPPKLKPPPSAAQKLAKQRGFYFVQDPAGIDDPYQIARSKQMKRDGFSHLQMSAASFDTDLHYPNLTTDWFENKVLPFLDDAAAKGSPSTRQSFLTNSIAAKTPPPATPDASTPTTTAPSDSAAAPAPGSLTPGPTDLTFTQRSPLSSQKEIGRRLTLKPADMGPDYDLSQTPFRAYFPSDFDPAKPQGVLVLLGFNNPKETPSTWWPTLDSSHMIFITPAAHFGKDNPPAVPLWQAMGLAMDAVYNLEHQCKIDTRRVYFMGWINSTQIAFATPDIFTGFILVDPYYFKRVMITPNEFIVGEFTPPLPSLFQDSKRHPFFLISLENEIGSKATTDKMAAMKFDGFNRVQVVQLQSATDLSYPVFSVDWFAKQALPFLDGNLPRAPKPAGSNTPSSPAASSAAALLSSARLYIANNQPELAKPKLQQIIDTYPDDPAAAKAKELLAQINQ